METSYVYKHIRLDKNEPFYIGIGNVDDFARAHDKVNRNNLWKKVAKKTNFEVEILCFNLSWELACQIEIYLIAFYGRKDLGLGPLCNLTDGGDGQKGRIIKESTREKIRSYQKGRKKSPETRARMKIASKKRGISQETRDKITASKKRNGRSSLEKRRPTICIETNKEFVSIKEAALYLNISKEYLAAMLRGRQPNRTSIRYREAVQ